MFITIAVVGVLAVGALGYKYKSVVEADLVKLKADISPVISQLEAAATKDEASAKADVAKVVAYIKTKI